MPRKEKSVLFKEIATVIQRRRLKLGLSVDQAAAIGGVSKSQWEKVESSSRYPTAHSIKSYCRALGVDLADLLEEAVNFRDYIASKIDAQLATYVIVRDGTQEPWEVFPSRNIEKDRADLTSKKHEMIQDGYMLDDDELILRCAKVEEQEQWRTFIDSQLASGDLEASGEDLDAICKHPVWVSPRFYELEEHYLASLINPEENSISPSAK